MRRSLRYYMGYKNADDGFGESKELDDRAYQALWEQGSQVIGDIQVALNNIEQTANELVKIHTELERKFGESGLVQDGDLDKVKLFRDAISKEWQLDLNDLVDNIGLNG